MGAPPLKKILSWIFGAKTHGLPKNYHKLLDRDAVDIVEQLKHAGFETYLVGGCVRDILLENKPKDFDIATQATPQQVKAVIKRCFIIGKRFRIVVAKRFFPAEKHIHEELFPVIITRAPEKEFQITTFRRTPEEFQGVVNENVFGTPQDDALRRDFAINGLFLDPFTGKIVDFVGGMDDLAKKRLRIIGNPWERFKEDPIRILRALRFMARAGLKFESQTKSALEGSLSHLALAKKERVREEVLKIFREGAADKVFAEFHRMKVWEFINPSFAKALKLDPKGEERLEHIASCVTHQQWKDSMNLAPLFYLLFAPFTLSPQKTVSALLPDIADTFKVSRKEREDLDRISIFLNKIAKEPLTNNFHRHLVENPKLVHSQLQCFYTLKILSDANLGEFRKIWTHWEGAWKKHLKFVYALSEKSRRRPATMSRPRPRRRPRPGTSRHGSGPGKLPPSSS